MKFELIAAFVAAAAPAGAAAAITSRFGRVRAPAARVAPVCTTTLPASGNTTTRIAIPRSTPSLITCRRGHRTTRAIIGTPPTSTSAPTAGCT